MATILGYLLAIAIVFGSYALVGLVFSFVNRVERFVYKHVGVTIRNKQ